MYSQLVAIVTLSALVGALGWTQSASPPPQTRTRDVRSVLPEIDRLFSAFAERNHVPGIAYGILVDGQLVHMGAAGVRDIASRAPVPARACRWCCTRRRWAPSRARSPTRSQRTRPMRRER